MEYKATPQFTKAIDDRTVTGLFAIHGNIDDGGDRSWPGSFADTKVNGRDRAVFLWQHDSSTPPIAVIKSIREVGVQELPAQVFAYAPNATGGVEVTREYLDTPRAHEVLAGIKAGAITEMSYAYDITRHDFEDANGVQVRNIRGVKLYDISDVNWGLNPATVGSKSFLGAGRTIEAHSDLVVSAVRDFVERVQARSEARAKEGRVFSSAHVAHLSELAGVLHERASALESLLESAAKPKADPRTVEALFLEWQRIQARINGANV